MLLDALGHFLAQGVHIAQGGATQAHALDLVGIGRTDAAAGGANFLGAAHGFTRLVQALVIGHGEVGAVGDEEVFRGDGDALAAQLGDLHHETDGVEDHAVADDVELGGPEDAAGH